jgi:hypothetical protein
VADSKGDETAERLLKKNPEAVINGMRMPPQPLPIESSQREPKRGWFSFLTGRS